MITLVLVLRHSSENRSTRRFLFVNVSLHRFTKKAIGCPDPVLSKYQPDRHFGAVSEKFCNLVMKYTELNPDKCLTDEEYEEK